LILLPSPDLCRSGTAITVWHNVQRRGGSALVGVAEHSLD
jgi:hypothetical protein